MTISHNAEYDDADDGHAIVSANRRMLVPMMSEIETHVDIYRSMSKRLIFIDSSASMMWGFPAGASGR